MGVAIVRLESDVPEVARRTLGDSPSVAAVISTQHALIALARERQFRRSTLASRLARRDSPGMPPSHVIRFELCLDVAHPSYQRDLGRLLTAQELEALAREQIREDTPGAVQTHRR